MTCKDCIHYDVCEALEEGNGIPKVHPKLCGCFKDKSRFIELPCKVGDKVWYITGIYHNLIKSAEIEEIIINETGIRELYVYSENGVYFENDYSIFFLTREEAEKALKERENNA